MKQKNYTIHECQDELKVLEELFPEREKFRYQNSY